MKKIDTFLNNIFSNDKIRQNLLKMQFKIWDNLSFNERVTLFKDIVDEISNMYPSFGKPNFNFVFMADNFSGEESEYGTFINIKMLEEGNHYEVLATCMHELRHFYQRISYEEFSKTHKENELFSVEELEAFKENEARSALYTFSNYIDLEEDNRNEYSIQPLEFDAEYFAHLFMQRFAKELLTSKDDIASCKFTTRDFKNIIKLQEGNSTNIIDFDRIYLYNYRDVILGNKHEFKREQEIYNKCLKLYNKLDYMRDDQMLIFFVPCFWDKFPTEEKARLCNAYLSACGCKDKITLIDNQYYLDDLIFPIDNNNVFAILEILFTKNAEAQIDAITSRELDNIKLGYEREIKINLMDERNIIKEEKNPLFYRAQPYMLFKSSVIKNQFLTMIKRMDSLYDYEYNFFFDYQKFLKKYDNGTIMKKVEFITNKPFSEYYGEVFNRMQENIRERKKTSK